MASPVQIPQQTVPVFAPDGTLGDIPAEKLHDALAAGFKQGVTMKSADGKLGVIPADRVPEAAKSGLKIVPLGDQETQQPGFWHSLYSDLAGMAKGIPSMVENAIPGVAMARATLNAPAAAQHQQEQKQAGYSLPYRVLTPAAEGLGVNVRGMEQSAQQGDVAGVAGHAATVPVVMAATAGLAKAAPAISDAASAAAERASIAAKRASMAMRDVTPKQAAVAAGGVGGAIAGHGPWSIVTGGGAGYTLGRVAEAVLGKDRANTPIFARNPDLLLDNISDALAQTIAEDRARFQQNQANGLGKLPQTGAQPAAQTGEALATQPASIGPEPPKGGTAPRFTQSDRAAAQSLLQDALKQQSGDVIDAAIPKQGNYAANLRTHAQVDFSLKRGDVAGAERVLDAAAKQVNPSWTPPEQRAAVPTTDDIRQAVRSGKYQPNAQASIAPPTNRAELLDDQAINQELHADLQMHKWSAESEARKEFIARNSTGFTKTGEGGFTGSTRTTPEFYINRALRGGKGAQAGAAPSGDLTDLLQKSLDEVRQRQQGK